MKKGPFSRGYRRGINKRRSRWRDRSLPRTRRARIDVLRRRSARGRAVAQTRNRRPHLEPPSAERERANDVTRSYEAAHDRPVLLFFLRFETTGALTCRLRSSVMREIWIFLRPIVSDECAFRSGRGAVRRTERGESDGRRSSGPLDPPSASQTKVPRGDVLHDPKVTGSARLSRQRASIRRTSQDHWHCLRTQREEALV